jgi:hypothetical protein
VVVVFKILVHKWNKREKEEKAKFGELRRVHPM